MKVKLCIGLFAIGLLTLNFTISGEKVQKNALSIQNIGLMQANAAEIACDKSTNDYCKYSAGSIKVSGKGKVKIYPR